MSLSFLVSLILGSCRITWKTSAFGFFFITQIANHFEKLLGIPGFSSKARWSRITGVSIILEPPAQGFKPHVPIKKPAVLGPISEQTYVEMVMVLKKESPQSKLMFSAVDTPKLGPGVHEHRWVLYLLTRVPIALIQ